MLRDKYRVVMPRRLLSIIDRSGGRQPFFDELHRMLEDCVHAFLLEVAKLLRPQMNSAAKRRLTETR